MDNSRRNHLGAKQENWWLGALIGGGIGLASTLLAALIMPFALLLAENPNGLVLPAAAVCVFLGGAIGGIIAANASKGREILAGIINIGIILVPMLLISFVFKKGFSPMNFLVIGLALTAASMIASTAVLKFSSNQKRNMKKIMKRR